MTEPYPPLPPAPASLPPAQAWGDLPRPGGALVAERKTGPGLLLRAAWFVLVGWWLTGFAVVAAWFLLLTLIGLPLGIWLINRIPTVLTLRPRTSYLYAYTDAYGRPVVHEAAIDQPPWVIRGLWFVVIGWWASGLLMAVAYALCLLLITLPVGLLLFNRVPFVASLYRY